MDRTSHASNQTGSGSEATFGTMLASHHASGHANLDLALGSSDLLYSMRQRCEATCYLA